jgi:predicted transcriptional regulator
MYYMKKVRKINARITDKVDKKLQEIVRSTGSNMSQVIMAAIEAYHAQELSNQNFTPYELAIESGIIGCAEGSKNLSTNYKKCIKADLIKKYDNR